jgi:hypothetical protein
MRLAVLAAAFVTIFGSVESNAELVRLDDQDRPPDGDIEIAGIIFSSGDFYGGQPCGVAGSGIGSATIAPNDWVNYQSHYLAGNLTRDGIQREGLSLYVSDDVILNSVTLMPHFSVSGYGGPVDLPFVMSYHIAARNAPTSISYLTVSDGTPETINLHSDFYDIYRLDLFVDSMDSNDNSFSTYRSGHGVPESIFQFGFTIQAMDITEIPEPGAAALLGTGLVAFGLGRRKLAGRF